MNFVVNLIVWSSQTSAIVEQFILTGIYIINLKKTWEKLLLAARAIAAIENPADICVISARPYGQRAVLKFASSTGSTPVAGRFTPGTFTNQIQVGAMFSVSQHILAVRVFEFYALYFVFLHLFTRMSQVVFPGSWDFSVKSYSCTDTCCAVFRERIHVVNDCTTSSIMFHSMLQFTEVGLSMLWEKLTNTTQSNSKLWNLYKKGLLTFTSTGREKKACVCRVWQLSKED